MSGPLWSTIVGALAVAAAACSSSTVSAFTVSPTTAELVARQTITLDVVPEPGAAEPADLEWTSSAPAVATVSPDGVVTGVAPGTTRITAQAGGRSGEVAIRVLDGGLVGAAGARLEAGGVAVVVPAGAAAENTAVSWKPPASTPMDPRLDAGSTLQVAFSAPLGAPATLEITYDPARAPIGLPAGAMRVARVNGTGWSEVDGGSDDAAAHRVRAPIAATGIYAARMGEAKAPCVGPEYRQFDFWLGTWNIRAVNGGGGHSVITHDPQGCVILEHFTDSGVVGLSVSFYNPGDRMWHQTYIDSFGTRIELSGGLVAGAMVLDGPGDARERSRITWQPLGENVRQFGEHTRDGGTIWMVEFDGTYSPAS